MAIKITGETIKFPAVGHVYEADFGETPLLGEFVVQLNFESETRMNFTIIKGQFKGISGTEDIAVVELRPSLYMVKWQEKKTETSVIHIEDFENGIVYANITLMDGDSLQLIQMKGTWMRVK